MAKPLVVHAEDGVRVPFLRGILTRSLQDAGLSFEKAYQIASTVRDELRQASEITTTDLREHVLRHLEPLGGEIFQRYRTHTALPPPIVVQHEDGHVSRFSRGQQRSVLAVCGMNPAETGRVVDLLVERLAASGVHEIPTNELGRLLHRLLDTEVGEETAHRYAVWEEYTRSEVPLLVLVGGATGTGKSTISTRVSDLLGIFRTQTTDMLREVMRMMVPERLLPVLHRSSFLAWRALPAQEAQGGNGDALPAGYLAQVEVLSVACEAVIRRALEERVSLILEGVHVHPRLADCVPDDADAIVVPVTLGVLKPKRLRQQIKGRGKRVPGRRAKRYLEHFDDIWRLQSFLLAEADRLGVPIVAHDEIEDAVEHVVHLVMRALSERFAGDPDKVFA